MLAPQAANRLSAFRKFMGQEDDKDLLSLFSRLNMPSILGRDSFLVQIKERFFKQKTDKQVPAAKCLSPSMEAITVQACKFYKVDYSDLVHIRRGIENEPRDVAIYLVRILRAEPLMRIGSAFNLNHYSSVSSAILRIKDRLGRDRKLQQRLKQIQIDIVKGHTEI